VIFSIFLTAVRDGEVVGEVSARGWFSRSGGSGQHALLNPHGGVALSPGRATDVWTDVSV
jgi:hypothetical protein